MLFPLLAAVLMHGDPLRAHPCRQAAPSLRSSPRSPQISPMRAGRPCPPRRAHGLRLASHVFPLRMSLAAQQEMEEQDLVAAINIERTQRGLEPLVSDPLLCVTARAHCREMCSLDYFEHRSPTPGLETPLNRYLAGRRAWGQERPSTALVGENIFYASASDSDYNVAYAHQRLMASPGHRANILEPRFTHVGVGLYRDSQGRFWVTEMFLGGTDE
jgi:uncharacterized protein YkwD